MKIKKKRVEEEWIEMEKNTVKCRFLSICHLSVPDFLNKKRSRGVRMVRSTKIERRPLLWSVEE